MVASDGGVFAFGDAHFAGSCPGIGGCSGAAVAVMPDASGDGYWLVTQTGRVYTFGDAANFGAPGPQSVPVTSAVRTPDGRGYWILFANGAIWPTATPPLGSLVGCVRRLQPGHRHLRHLGRRWLLGGSRQWLSGRLRRRAQRRLHGRDRPQRLDHRRERFVEPSSAARSIAGGSTVRTV